MANGDDNNLNITIGGTAKEWNAVVEETKKINSSLQKSIQLQQEQIRQGEVALANEKIKQAERAAAAQKATLDSIARARQQEAQRVIAEEKKIARESELASKAAKDAAIKAAKERADAQETSVNNIAKYSAVAFAATAGAIAITTKSYIDYQTQLTAVGITTNQTGEKLKNFGRDVQDLSKKIPLSTNELLNIAQAAGQLGVKGNANILKFTETVAKIGAVTGLSGQEAATSLSKILTVTQEGIGNIDTLGSVVVALGNSFAASKKEIIAGTLEIARATTVYKVSSAQAAALAAAMKNLGIQAGNGGMVVGRAMREISNAIDAGGSSAKRLSNLTGIASKDLKKAFKDDAAGVFEKFLQGLKQVENGGGNVAAVLKTFNLSGERLLRVIPALALNSDLLGKALSIAGKETENATALNRAAAEAFSTLGSDTKRLENNLSTLATNIGEQLAPEVSTLVNGLSKITSAFNEGDSGGVKFLATILKFAFALFGSIATVAASIAGYIGFTSAIETLTVALEIGKGAILGFTGAATLGLTLIIAYLPEIIDGVGHLFELFSKKPDTGSLDEITNKLHKLNAEKDKINENKDTSGMAIDRLRAIDKEVEALKKLQAEKIKSSSDFGTGELLVKPKVADFNDKFSFEQETIPLAPQGQLDEVAKQKVINDKIVADKKKATLEKIQVAKDEADRLEIIRKLDSQYVEKGEIDLVSKRLKLEDEKSKALLEKDTDLKNALLASNQQKFLDLEAEEKKYYISKEIQAQEDADREKIFEQLNRDADKATRELWDTEDIQDEIDKLQTEEQLKAASAKKALASAEKERQTRYNDEQKNGKVVAAMQAFFRNEEVQGFASASGQLAQLANSRHNTMKSIGKAASMVNIGIATAEGAIKAYTSLVGIPIIGPALGIAAAAAITAYGIEQEETVAKMADGGFVGGSLRGARDNVPIMAEQGELIVPKMIAPNFIQAIGMPNTQANPTTNKTNTEFTVNLELNQRASEYVSLDQRRGKKLGTIGR